MFIIITGKTYKKQPKIPFILYFNIILESVVPSVKPLKNKMIITAGIPIIEIPSEKIINN